jgi:hypothetical protein
MRHWLPVSKWLFHIAHASLTINNKAHIRIAHTSLTIYSKAHLSVTAPPHTLAFMMVKD